MSDLRDPRPPRPTVRIPHCDGYIDGRWSPSSTGATYRSLDPVDGHVVAEIAAGTAEDVDRAVRAAQRAFDAGGWVGMGGAERGRILAAAAEAIAADAETLAALETLEMGKLYRDGLHGDIPAAADTWRYYAGFADKLYGSTVRLPDYAGRSRLNYTLREPLGVVGAITPWNNPILVASWKIAPALAAGNTVVVKPPEDAALSLLRLAEILADVGVPAGVFNLVPGHGAEAGAALARHPGLAKLSFTGSPEVGATMSHHVAGQFRKVALELGGKNPQIVFPDADLDTVMPFVALANFLNQGQVCAAGTRVYVHDSIVDDVVARLAAHAEGIVLGDPFDEDVTMGPVVHERALHRILGYVETARTDGATVVAGGARGDGDGWFVEPTVLLGQQHHGYAREEIFGPVATVMPFSTVDEAIGLANDTPFGLNAIVYTESLHLAQRAARDLRVGNVWVNGFGAPDARTPWGGRRGSGVGRELGPTGIEAYTEEKTVHLLF